MNPFHLFPPRAKPNPAAPPTQLRTIVVLFVILRLTLLFLYTPQGLFNAYTNYQHYFRAAQFSEQGFYPFVNMWYEYPPLAAYLSQAAYSLTRLIMPAGDIFSFTYQVFARVQGLLLLLFETGVLILLHRLAALAWNIERANWTAWVYASLSLPLFFWNTSQDTSVVFWLLLALYGFSLQRHSASALALGLGMATKFTPVFLLGPVIKFLWPQRRTLVKYGLIAGLTTAAVYVPFLFLGGGPWIAASFTALAKVGSWSTPWALLDGNWDPAYYGPLEARTQLELANVTLANPPLIPGWIILALFAVLYGWILLRPLNLREPKQFIWLTTLTAMIFHLWSKGWSPQWATLIIPLWLLSFPDSRGLKLILLLTAIVFVEWALAGVLGSREVVVFTVVSRTLLFIAGSVLIAKKLWPPIPTT